jgi:hypothetical protein
MQVIKRVAIVALPLLLLTASGAYAADTASQAYGGPAGANQEVAAGSVAGGSLPFTGSNLAIVVAIGLGLLLTGFVLRRAKSTN